MTKEEEAKQIIFEQKLLTKEDGTMVAKNDFLSTSYRKVLPTLSRRIKAKIYSEYKAVYELDKLRVGRLGYNPKTNLSVR